MLQCACSCVSNILNAQIQTRALVYVIITRYRFEYIIIIITDDDNVWFRMKNLRAPPDTSHHIYYWNITSQMADVLRP